jgi:hypothetical protein
MKNKKTNAARPNEEPEHAHVRIPSYTRFIKTEKLVPGKNPRGDVGDVSDLVKSLDHAPMLHNIVVRPLTTPISSRSSQATVASEPHDSRA